MPAGSSSRSWPPPDCDSARLRAPPTPTPLCPCISVSPCYDAEMTKVRTTLTIDEAVLRAVKIRAARTGQGDSEVIEGALRSELGLDLLERLWARDPLLDAEATALAVEAQHATRPRASR